MKRILPPLLALVLALPAAAQFGDAQWIGTEAPTLYASYLPQFRLHCTVQLDEKSHSHTAAILFGGNDPRLMDRNKNILGVENGPDESYIKVELKAAEGQLNIYRVNYTTRGEERLKTFPLPASVTEKRYSPHDIGIACCLGHTDFFVDGAKLGSAGLNPIGNGGDYIAFPQLAHIGHEMEAGQVATLSHVKVLNYRTPCAALYEDTAPRRIGNKRRSERVLHDPSHGSMPLLQCQFALKDKPVQSASLTATARGIYIATLNRQRVGREYFAPGISQYNKTHYYQTYDIAPLLAAGRNTLQVQLTEGWWAGGMTYSGGNWNYFGDQLAFMARIAIRYTDGDSTIITTQPDTWKVCADSPVRYASMFQGEVYDHTTDGSAWQPAKALTLDGHLPTEGGGTMPAVNDYTHFTLSPAIDDVQPYTTLSAQSVAEVRPHVYVYDMGQNMAGVPTVRLSHLAKGQQLTFRYAEVLYPDLPDYHDKAGTLMLENLRAAMAQDIYIARGEREEVFTPELTLHGYRYLEVTGLDRPLPLEAVQGNVLSSVHSFTAHFECSNPLVNRLWQNIQWSMLANFVSLPTDCPQRNERMGWSGDISVFSRTAVHLADVNAFLRKHLQAMRDVQTPEGRFPDIAPVGGGFGGLLWGSAGITVPWECYLQYADTLLLAQHYDAMQAYINYVDTHYFDPQTHLLVQERQWGDLGDWLGLEDGKNDKTLLFEAYYIHDLDIMRRTALLLGHTDDAARYARRLQERKQFFISTYIHPDTGKTIASAFRQDKAGQEIDIQGSYVLPLAFHIAEGPLREKLIRHLARTIERENTTDDGTACPPYSLMTGFITTAWISRALSDNGRTDLAYRLLQQTSYPSWLYPVTQGATTIWERLNSYTHHAGFGAGNSMNSFNHYSFGAVGQWLIGCTLGIERDENHPGFSHFVLRPQPDPTRQMTFARGHLDTRHGRIHSSWTRTENDSIRYQFTIPEGTTATLMLPGKEPQELEAGTYTF